LKPYELTRQEPTCSIEEGQICWEGVNEVGAIFRYAVNKVITAAEFDHLFNTLKQLQPDAIGMTVNTPLFRTAERVTRQIKEHLDVPVIWGGIHPTISAATCLEFCDCACVGEGDETIVKIADAIDKGEDFRQADNLTYLSNGRRMVNSMSPLQGNLDAYPARDNSPEGKYFIDNDQIISNYGVVNDKGPGGLYQAMSSRGCPYKCACCCEAPLKALYAGQTFLRQRSVENVIEELVDAKQSLGIKEILFEDEVFCLNTRWIEKFAPLYKEKVDLPFSAYLYPSRGIENNLRLLKDAGLKSGVVALQSGSERINKEVFRRVYNREYFLNTAQLCKEIGITFDTDVITYNPYEQEEDLEQTLEVLMDMRGGFQIAVNRLFIMPNTELAERIKRDGILGETASRNLMFNYYCRLFYIATYFRNPRRVVGLIKAIGIFRKYPQLLIPSMVKALRHPTAPARTLILALLPASVRQVLKRNKQRLSFGKQPA